MADDGDAVGSGSSRPIPPVGELELERHAGVSPGDVQVSLRRGPASA